MSPCISVRSLVHICISKLLHNILFAWEYSNALNEVKILQLYYLRLCNKFGHFYHIAYIFRAIGKKGKEKLEGTKRLGSPRSLRHWRSSRPTCEAVESASRSRRENKKKLRGQGFEPSNRDKRRPPQPGYYFYFSGWIVDLDFRNCIFVI